ncbi:MAG TPA: hypothetical protein VHB99_08920, partial [Pirellulales bacterium]|nr:hypothetical protein [Pirellulales bacterium]
MVWPIRTVIFVLLLAGVLRRFPLAQIAASQCISSLGERFSAKALLFARSIAISAFRAVENQRMQNANQFGADLRHEIFTLVKLQGRTGALAALGSVSAREDVPCFTIEPMRRGS